MCVTLMSMHKKYEINRSCMFMHHENLNTSQLAYYAVLYYGDGTILILVVFSKSPE